jgi:hypothetical protein
MYRKIPKRAGAAFWALVLGLGVAITPSVIDAHQSYSWHCMDVYQLHTLPALEIERNLEGRETIGVEGAGSTRFHTSGRVNDLVGLNNYPLAHARDDRELASCLVVGSQLGLVMVPTDMLGSLQSLFNVQELRRFHVPRWSVVGGNRSRTTIIARVSPRQEVMARCIELFGSDTEEPRP